MNLFAAICGIVGSACYLAFFIGGRRDNDGQGTNMTWILVCAISEQFWHPIVRSFLFDKSL